MTGSLYTRLAAGVMLACCLLAAALMRPFLQEALPVHGTNEVTFLPSPYEARLLSLGYPGLAADLYWTRAVQYFGRRVNVAGARFDSLPPLLAATTQLDPQLLPAYELGSIFLAQDAPRGAGRPDEAVALLERGIRENPGEWHLYYTLGFVHYFNRRDYTAAQNAFEQGSRLPGAHPWLKQLAARMAEKGGNVATARFLWAKAYEEARDPLIRANAMAHLRELEDAALLPAGNNAQTVK